MSAPQVSKDRKIYRRRRLLDVLRLLPVLALVLFVAPVILAPAGQSVSSAPRLIYFVLCWFALIALAFLASRALAATPQDARDRDDG